MSFKLRAILSARIAKEEQWSIALGKAVPTTICYQQKNKPKSTRNKSAAMEFVGVEQNSSDEDLLLSSQVARHAESNAGQEPHLANLELNDLRLANALQTMEGKTGPKDVSKYAKHGMCKKRIAKSLAKTCGCHMPCSDGLSGLEVEQICCAFWSLGKNDQDLVLYSLQSNSGLADLKSADVMGEYGLQDEMGSEFSDSSNSSSAPPTAKKKRRKRRGVVRYHLQGKRVCKKALYRLLAIGQHRFDRCAEFPADKRYNKGGVTRARDAPVTQWLNNFCASVYCNIAEYMPVKLEVNQDNSSSGGDVDSEGGKVLVDFENISYMDVSEVLTLLNSPDGKRKLPKKYLGPGHLIDVFYMAMAAAEQERMRAPSLSQFKRVWKKWRQVIKRRKHSEHKQCSECWRLLQAMRRTSNVMTKANLLKQFQHHVNTTLTDRIIYYAFRSNSRRLFLMLCIMCDSMDKSKWPIPRLERLPKNWEKLRRGTMTISLVRVHGFGDHWFVQDETVSHGSDNYLTLIYTALQYTFETCQAHRKPWLEHVSVHTDNTPSQAKNQYGVLGIGMLSAKLTFSSSAQQHLQVGHSHEDADQSFGVANSTISKQKTWQTPREVVQMLRDKLPSIFATKQK